MNRENAGYTITDSVTVGNSEIVIGENPQAPDPYVCWYCKNGSDYFWGAYSKERNEAVRKLCERAEKEIRLMENSNPPPKRSSNGAR